MLGGARLAYLLIRRSGLNQIWLQVRGVRALQSERVAQSLELSELQRGRLTRLLSGGFLGRAAQVEAQALALLSDEQRQQFVAMQGLPFARQQQRGEGAGTPAFDGRGRNR